MPFLIAGAGLMHGQERVRKPVSLVDTAPTILDLLGIASRPDYQGRTMLDHTPRMALFLADYSLGLLGLRDGPWKFVYETGSGRSKLFDLAKDPHEVSDVSAAERARARVKWYAQTLRDWSGAQIGYITRGASQ